MSALKQLTEPNDEVLVIRLGPKPNQYHIRGIVDLPLTKREMIILLVQNLVTPEEIGIMLTEFQTRPGTNEAHFGIMGEFLFVTTYIPNKD